MMDEIRRRLAEIDKELASSPAYYYRQTIRTAPLAFCAVGMMAGIVVQNAARLPTGFWVTLIALSAAAAFTWLVAQRWGLLREINSSFIMAYVALVCFVCLGAIQLASFNRPGPNDISNLVADKRTLATIRGVIVTKPYTAYIDSNEWRFSRFTHTDPGSSFYLKITEAETTAGWAKTRGIIRVRVNEPVLDLKLGDYVQMYCRLQGPQGASNAGEFDVAKYLSRKGVFVVSSVESRQTIEVLKGGNTRKFGKTRAALQKIAVQALLGGSQSEDEEEGLLLALVLGYRGNISHETFEAFRQTGLLHFICLSGMNFAMVIGFVWWVCKTAGLLKPGRAIVCMLAAILFLLVVPENAPAFRAAVMCFAFCGAYIVRRRSNPLNSLALAAVVLLLIRPTGLFEPDWQLSFASVLGILLLAKPIDNLLREKAYDRFGGFAEGDPAVKLVRKVTSVAWTPFAVTLAAWLASEGLLSYHFYAVHWLTSVWTVLVSPLIGLVSVLGYLKLVVALFLPSVGAAMSVVVNWLAGLLIAIVKFIAGLGISEIVIGTTTAWAIVLYYTLIAYAFFFHLRSRLIKKVVCTAAIVSLVVIAAMTKWQRTEEDTLVVTALDVGHGQAVVAQLPGGQNILFDAGSSTRKDIGTRIVAPFLRYSGIGKVDAILISHGDIDHINGSLEVAETNGVYAGEAFFSENRQSVRLLRDELQHKGISVIDINHFPQVFGPAKVRVLWPNEGVFENGRLSDNDRSEVTMIEYAGRRLLICSDIERFAQREILRLYPDLKADVLIAPHHGSVRTLDPTFVERIGANVVICSCTGSAYEKQQVLEAGEDFSSYYTGKDGAVTVNISGGGKVETNAFRRR